MKKLINLTGLASPHLSRKFTYLLMLLVSLIWSTGTAWADTTLLTYTVSGDVSNANTDMDAGIGKIQAGTTFKHDTQNNHRGWKLDGDPTSQSSSNKFVLLKLTGTTFEEGDKITITGETANTPSVQSPQGFMLYNSKGGNNTLASYGVLTAISGTKSLNVTFEIPENSDLIGKSEVYVFRYTSNSAYLESVKITRPGEVVPTLTAVSAPKTWDFTLMTTVTGVTTSTLLPDYTLEYNPKSSSGSSISSSNGLFFGGGGQDVNAHFKLNAGSYKITVNAKSSNSDNRDFKIKIGSTVYALGTGAEWTEYQKNVTLDAVTDIYVYTATSGYYIKTIAVENYVEPSGPTATFLYGANATTGTQWENPTEAMTITIPAHKAGQTINVTVTPEDGATIGDINNGSKSGNVVSFTAPEAGNNTPLIVTIPVTKNAVTTNYTITVNTETAIGVTWDPQRRYSKDIINARIGNFYGNTSLKGFNTFDENGENKVTAQWKNSSGTNVNDHTIDYVVGLVAKGIIEAADYYKTTDPANAKRWYYSIADYGNDITVSEAGGSLDNLNAAKLYFGLYDLTKNGGAFNRLTGADNVNSTANTKLGKALNGLSAHNSNYSFGATSYPNNKQINSTDLTGGWFHKSEYLYQMWCDGAYMGPALLAQLNNYGHKINNAGDWDLITKQFTLSWPQLWNSTDKLLYHAFTSKRDEDKYTATWAGDAERTKLLQNSDVYHSASYWGRADGWYFLALIDVLEQMQIAGLTATANYSTLKGYANELAAGIAARQDATTGCWYQLLDKNDTYSAIDCGNGAKSVRVYNYLESSATAIFTAAFFKGQRLGIFTNNYSEVAKKAYQGIVENFMYDDQANGLQLYWCSRSAGLGNSNTSQARLRDGSNAYYLKGYDVAPTKITDDNQKSLEPNEIFLFNGTEGKVLGAFIMAATEYERAYIDAVPQYVVYLSTDGNGTVSAVYTDGGAPFTSGDKVNKGTSLTITATPNPGYKFSTDSKPWGSATSSKVNPLTFVINDNKTFTAHFEPVTPPTITAQPASAEYERNAATTALSVTATPANEGALTYQWYSNTANINIGGTLIEGKTNSTLDVSSAKVGTSYYYCVVKGDDNGEITTDVAKIVVKATCTHEHTGVTIGNTDQTTPYRGARSEAVAINKGETKKFRFTNHGNTDNNFNNWNLVVATADSKPTGVEPETEEMVLRADWYGWGETLYNAVQIDFPQGWKQEQFREDMWNAEVEVTVVYNDNGTMTITAKSEANSRTYTETETTTATEGQKYIYFVVDQSHMTNFRELVTFRAVASNGSLVSITENGNAIAGAASNVDCFVEPNAKIVVTTTADASKYLKVWNVNGTVGDASSNEGNDVYTINNILANTIVTAKYEAKSNETLPAPEGTDQDTEGETLLNSFTAIPFSASQAGNEQTIALNLPPYATAKVKSGDGASIDGDNLTITAPAQNSNMTVTITVTAHDGTTAVDYTIKFSTNEAPSYTYTVNAVDGSSNVLKQLATGEASSAVVAYPQHILKESTQTLYTINHNGSGDWFRKTVVPTKADDVINFTYNGTSVSNVVFYKDGEDIDGWSKANNAQRASQGQMGYGEKTEVATLNPGTYVISARGVNGNSATRNAIFTVGDKEVYNFAITNGTDVTGTSKSFTIWEKKKLYVSCDGSSISGLDWFYVKKPDVLDVTENNQKFPFITEVVDNSECADKKTSGTHSSTKDGVKGTFCGIKNPEHYVNVTETGALGFYIKAYHNNGSDTRTVDIYDGSEKLGSLSVAPGTLAQSTVFALTSGQHTIKVNGTGKDVYIADIIFLTEQPRGSLTNSEGEMKVTEKSGHEFDLASTSGGAISMTSETSNDYATLNFNTETNKLTVTPKKYGKFEVSFNIAANGAYLAGTATYTVNIRRENLEMTLSDNYLWNKTTHPDNRPVFSQPVVTVKDEAKNEVHDLTYTYATDDQSVATVDGTTITPTYNQGSANITISFAGNDSYAPVEKQWAVSVIDGYVYKVIKTDNEETTTKTPVLNEKRVLDDGHGNALVNFSFGGWQYSMTEGTGKDQTVTEGKYSVNGSSKTDTWADPKTQDDLAPIDGYEYGISGAQDAVEETKNKSIEKIYGSDRYGWFQAGKPYSLPVRGSFMTFEPTKNGMLTIYIVQNGAWNTETKTVDGKSKNVIIPGEFRPHAFYLVNQAGTPVQTFAPESFNVVTKQHVTDEYKCIMDRNAQGYYDANNIAQWPEFNTYLSPAEQAKVYAAWAGGTNGAQKIVELDNHAYLAIQKGIVKYTFHAVAGQTYYLFSNFSKLGFSGLNFVEDEGDGTQPTVDLVLADNTQYNVLKSTAPVEKVTDSQFRTITYNRTFTAGQWTSICLPFYMSPTEVKANFGDATQIITFDGAEVPQNGNVTTFHFVYHEIQGILAGYPYLIKPSKNVTYISVKNKIAYPEDGTSGPGAIREFSTNRYWNKSVDVYREEDSNQPYTFVGSYNGATIKDGAMYCNNVGKLQCLKSGNQDGLAYPRYRAFLRLNEEVLPTPQALSKSFAISMGGIVDNTDDSATMIDELFFDESTDYDFIQKHADGIYNLNGQKMNAKNLQRGIYIINGKKYNVKSNIK